MGRISLNFQKGERIKIRQGVGFLLILLTRSDFFGWGVVIFMIVGPNSGCIFWFWYILCRVRVRKGRIERLIVETEDGKMKKYKKIQKRY